MDHDSTILINPAADTMAVVVEDYPHHVNLPFLMFPDEDMSWRDHSICAGSTVNFFTNKKSVVAEQKALCSRCPVRVQCLDFAVRNDQEGTWGGMTEGERKEMARA